MGEVAYLSLGSNIGDREANLREAIEQIKAIASMRSLSSFYEAQPVDLPNQPWFLNCAIALETNQTPHELLKSVLAIEAGMGRVRFRDKGPRKIDIDIVLFGDQSVNDQDLTIPHPAMHERRFVLAPLAEIAPAARHPLLNKAASELLSDLPEGQIVRRIS
ncbi:MAG: 2-amino-4-hydroxy-6-hydroxymethyldihydropteridine diphosphokinase [Terriglobales bacterium]|jgi:2-amino-4-hydroxy-6-hydroxymethyldihydropteridine diphosphokinase